MFDMGAHVRHCHYAENGLSCNRDLRAITGCGLVALRFFVLSTLGEQCRRALSTNTMFLRVGYAMLFRWLFSCLVSWDTVDMGNRVEQ